MSSDLRTTLITMHKISRLFAIIFAAGISYIQPSSACTGISLTAKDGSKIIARTMEWGGFRMESHLVLVPRGHSQQVITPTGKDGMILKAKYGYTGIAVLKDNFMAEGINEKGLIGELFYFPGYGECEEYNPANKSTTITDAQFLDWVLGSFATVEEMIKSLDKIHFTGFGRGFESTHYSIGDASGRHIVLEYYNGKFHVHENKIGVITNSPSYDWHMTNLNNYVNVFAGASKPQEIAPGVTLKSIGMGSAGHGLPGDLTPPSRFVRAAFYVTTARPQDTGEESVMQTFQILNNFDLPLGAEFRKGEKMPDMLSGTQWTTSTDLKAMKFYYKTEWNSSIRCIDLNEIDFAKANYQLLPIDKVEKQPVEYIHFN